MKKTLIQNADIVTSTKVFRGDLLIEGERIREVGERITAGPGVKIIDAGGHFVLPGAVDAHTHFDLDVGIARASDDFHTGSIAAACGGTTTIIDHMAFGPKGCRLTHQPEVYHRLADHQSVVDYGFHGTVQHVDQQVLEDMAVLREQGITSVKVYLTYDFKVLDDDLLILLSRANQLDMMTCVHCENDAIVQMVRHQLAIQGKLEAKYHPVSRPAQAEAEAVFRMLMLAKTANQAPLYIVHLSTMLGLQAIQLARHTGQRNIYAETCPQYLLLDDSLYNDPQQGLKYTMSPPLRKKTDQQALWNGLEDGSIDTVATDHCPFFFETQKQMGKHDFMKCPNGAPGVELRLPLMFSEGYSKGRLTLPEIVKTCCTRPAEIFGIAPQKGDIRPGADADLVLFDPDAEWTASHSLLHEHVDYTPYEGFRLKGKPVMTLSRGEVIVENGVFTGKTGRGRYLKRGCGS